MGKDKGSVFTSLFRSLREDSLFIFEHMGIDEGEGAIKYIVSKYLHISGVYRFSGTVQDRYETAFESEQFERLDFGSKIEKIIRDVVKNIEKKELNKNGGTVLEEHQITSLSSFLCKDTKELDFGYGPVDESGDIYYYYLRTSKNGYLLFSGKNKYEYSSEVLGYLAEQYHIFKLQQDKIDISQSMLYIDEVTGVYNTRYLDMILDSEIKRSLRFKEEFSLLFLDLDEFKKVNDIYGHLTGSSVLVQVATLFKNTLRQIDTIVRYGGDEFIVLLLNTNESQAMTTAERLRSKVEESMFYTHDNKHKLHLTVSIGIASFPKVDTKEKLLKIADEAMYMSKRSGKNQVMIWQNNIVDYNSRIDQNFIKIEESSR